MKIDRLLEENDVELYLYHGYEWDRDGFYYPAERIIYVNADLDQEERTRVILHELGHIHHNPADYQRLLLKYENQAERYMIKELIAEYLIDNDPQDFNWLNFAKHHHISTTWGQEMIQDEFRKAVGL